MTEKGCDNCYYSYFDERAYPCSLCIRGIERTDQWQPSKKTKADRKTENSSEKPNNCEPQTDYKKWEAPPKVDLPTGEITTCVSVLARQFLGYACETCKHRDEDWNSEACDGCCENHDHYEPQDEPQTDCSWK